MTLINDMLRNNCPGFRYDDALEYIEKDTYYFAFNKTDGIVLLPEEKRTGEPSELQVLGGFDLGRELRVIYMVADVLCSVDAEKGISHWPELLGEINSECVPYLVYPSLGYYSVMRAIEDAQQAIEEYEAGKKSTDETYLLIRSSYGTIERICQATL